MAFDPTKTHSENLDAFLASLETRHAEFGAILREQLPVLTNGVEDDLTRRQARHRFNHLVKQRLDELASR